MRNRPLTILLTATALLAGRAHAQETPAPPAAQPDANAPAVTPWIDPPWDGDMWRHVDAPAHNPYRVGLKALDAGDFVRAEEFFAGLVRRKPRNAEANFYLGATRMDLGEWTAAKQPLEFAVTKLPEHPDPKSRLGVTYAMLGDAAGARRQRADLVRMAEACRVRCRLSPYIASGIAMIDEALIRADSPG